VDQNLEQPAKMLTKLIFRHTYQVNLLQGRNRGVESSAVLCSTMYYLVCKA
jgi:hypothetical protein